MSKKQAINGRSSLDEAVYESVNFADAVKSAGPVEKLRPMEQQQLRRVNPPLGTWKNSPLTGSASFNLTFPTNDENFLAHDEDGEVTPLASETFRRHQAPHQYQQSPLTIIYLCSIVVLLCASTYLQLRRLHALEQEVFRMSRDSIASQDFAFRFNGGRVITNLTSENRSEMSLNDPILALDDDLRPGRCWRLPGTTGQIGITLSEAVQISGISVDHVPKELVSSIRGAPRRILVWGSLTGSQKGVTTLTQVRENSFRSLAHLGDGFEGKVAPPIHSSETFYLPLAFVEYNIHAKSHIQTFPVFASVANLNVTFTTVVMEIMSNWGGISTCLYRVRVHGKI